MRYILAGILVFFAGCFKKQSDENDVNITKKTNINIKKCDKKVEEEQNFIKTIRFENFELIFKNNKLIYPNKRVVLFFENNRTYSRTQELVLEKLKINYIKVDSKFLHRYFNIVTFPTIIVLEKNKTIRYENFVPYEILKVEGF